MGAARTSSGGVLSAGRRRARRTRGGLPRAPGLALAIVLAGWTSFPAAAQPTDSTSFRLELGQRTDLTNEQYVDYEELFVDSTFAGARAKLASIPEQRYGGFAAAGVAGTRDAGSTRYRLDGEALIGDLLSTARLAGTWRRDSPTGWRWQVDPEAEYRVDRTFDRDRDEWRSALGARVRRTSVDGVWAGEWRARGDVLRVSGNATDLLLDRQTLTLGSALERMGLLGDVRLAYGLAARVFPDSASRDHLEHQFELSGRGVLPGGQVLAYETRWSIRGTVAPATLTRDDYQQQEGALEFGWLPAPSWGGTARCEAEAIQYDRPDSSLYVDSQRLRGTLGVHFEPRRGATVQLEASVERAWSAATPGEEYLELAAGPGLEWFGAGAWWDFASRAGRRRPAEPGLPLFSGSASAYQFLELQLGAEQPLGPALRLRLTGSGRIEEHDDPSRDSRSLFVSAELRWLAIGTR